jgi:hypothetical protein
LEILKPVFSDPVRFYSLRCRLAELAGQRSCLGCFNRITVSIRP